MLFRRSALDSAGLAVESQSSSCRLQTQPPSRHQAKNIEGHPCPIRDQGAEAPTILGHGPEHHMVWAGACFGNRLWQRDALSHAGCGGFGINTLGKRTRVVQMSRGGETDPTTRTYTVLQQLQTTKRQSYIAAADALSGCTSITTSTVTLRILR